MRASVSTVDFMRWALGFSVFGRIWWYLVLEQIIQTFMEQHQLLVLFCFVFCFFFVVVLFVCLFFLI